MYVRYTSMAHLSDPQKEKKTQLLLAISVFFCCYPETPENKTASYSFLLGNSEHSGERGAQMG